MAEHPRRSAFSRNVALDEVLQELNELIGSAESARFGAESLSPRLPVVFVVGAPRSGTTLMMQWLAASGSFAYPSNLMARFYGAPYTGSRIQQLLTDPTLDFKNELQGSKAYVTDWSSDTGKTEGFRQPHEFFFFWRRFFPVDQARSMTEEEVGRSDPKGFAHGIALIERAFGKPFSTKGILLQYDLLRLAEWLPTAVFIHMEREPLYNMQSLLLARERVYGSRDVWFSVRPPEFDWLRNERPAVQVGGQIVFTNDAIHAQLNRLAPNRKLFVPYERFCAEPKETWDALAARLGSGVDLGKYAGPRSFRQTNDIQVSASDWADIEAAYESLASRGSRPDASSRGSP